MRRFAIMAAIGLAAVLAVPAGSSAQTADQTKPVTGMKPDRVTADPATRKAMQAKEAELRKKRADCRAQAKAEKIPLMKRAAWLKDCRARLP